MPNIFVSVKCVAGYLMALPPLMLLGCQSSSNAAGVPALLKQRVDCMYKVLRSTPGVTEPRIGSVTRDGWAHPFLEYRAAETNSWMQPTRFETKRGASDQYWFEALVPGIIDPRVGQLDLHVTDSVVEQWKDECHAEAIVVSE